MENFVMRRTIRRKCFKSWCQARVKAGSTLCKRHHADRLRKDGRPKALKSRTELTKLRKISRYQRLKSYGLTEDSYESMLKGQGGCCKICEIKFGKKHLNKSCIDHCHKTGAVRGLLCTTCNLLLGFFEIKHPGWMTKARRYLIESQKRHH